MAWTLSVQAQGGATTEHRRGIAPDAHQVELPAGRGGGPSRPCSKRYERAKDDVMKRQMELLAARYDLSDRPAGPGSR